MTGLFISGVLGSLVACSLDSVDRKGTLSVRVSDPASRNTDFLSPTFLQPPGTPPVSASEFDCLAVNVTGPGIADSSHHPEPGRELLFERLLKRESYCSYRGLLAGPILNATIQEQEISLSVTPGATRLVQVIGVKERGGSNSCVTEFNSSVAQPTNEADLYEVGRAVVDLYRDQTVSIAMDWNGLSEFEKAKRILNCDSNSSPNPGNLSTVLPTQLGGVSAVSDIAMSNHTCYVQSGNVYCKGNNSRGQIGNGAVSPTPVLNFVQVPGITAAIQVVVSSESTCARIGTSSVKCWGAGTFGQLGSGSYLDSVIPVTVSGLFGNIKDLAVGYSHACVIEDLMVKCWGNNSHSEFGNGNVLDSASPVASGTLSGTPSRIAVGDHHTCVLLATGAVQCWGSNEVGQVGNNGTMGGGASQNTPVTVFGLTAATKLSAGADHTCAVAPGSVKCWGRNSSGQLGHGNQGTTESAVPVTVTGLLGTPLQVAAGAAHTCVFMSPGVQCWGADGFGQRGAGASGTVTYSAGAAVPGLGPITLLAGGSSSTGTCILGPGGTATCWGSNLFRQISP